MSMGYGGEEHGPVGGEASSGCLTFAVYIDAGWDVQEGEGTRQRRLSDCMLKAVEMETGLFPRFLN